MSRPKRRLRCFLLRRDKRSEIQQQFINCTKLDVAMCSLLMRAKPLIRIKSMDRIILYVYRSDSTQFLAHSCPVPNCLDVAAAKVDQGCARFLNRGGEATQE